MTSTSTMPTLMPAAVGTTVPFPPTDKLIAGSVLLAFGGLFLISGLSKLPKTNTKQAVKLAILFGIFAIFAGAILITNTKTETG